MDGDLIPERVASHLGFPLSKEVSRKMSYFHRLMRSPLGAVILLLIAVGSQVPPLLYVAPLPILLAWLGVVDTRKTKRFLNWGVGCWLYLITFVLEFVLGVHVRTFGHKGQFKRRSLFIMNHISHFDWMYFWLLMVRQGDLSALSTVTKDMMGKIPIFGQSMQYGNFIFISRHWEKDKQEFQDKLYYYNGLNLPLQLLLFPEGGDLNTRTKTKSHHFADENGLPRYDFCLHPRTTGFLYTVNAMRDNGLDAIYDITMGYPDAISKTEVELFKGYIPREIHYYIRSYDAKDLPTDDEKLAEWCKDRWEEKEEELRGFYTHKEFLDKVSPAEGDRDKKANGSPVYTKAREVFNPKQYFSLSVGVVFWTTMNVLVIYFVYSSLLFALYGIVGFTFTVYATLWKGGIDRVMMGLSKDSTDRALACSRQKNRAA